MIGRPRVTFGLVALVLSTVAVLLLMGGCSSDSGTNQPDGASAKQLIVASYGGAWQEAQKKTMFGPFKEQSGIDLRDVVYDGQYAKIREMVNAGRVEWDVVDVEGNMVILGAREQLLEPIDYTVVPKADLIEGALHDYGTGIVAWSWVLAFKKGALTQEQLESPWASFFDPKAVSGARGLRNDPRRTLEIALLADGVAANKIYPLDVDRAFRVLTRFRDQMKAAGYPIIWWDAYAQPPQLLRDGEVVLTPAANGRIADAQKEGAPLDFIWKHGIVDMDWWLIPKGSKRLPEAMKFIAFASSPDVQAAIVQEIPYGPVNKHALDRIPEHVRKNLPTYPANLDQQIMFDTQWWARNLDQIQERWNQWRTGA